VLRPEDRDRTAIEGGHARHSEPLSRCHQDRVGQPR
jgi:hypothetical protein